MVTMTPTLSPTSTNFSKPLLRTSTWTTTTLTKRPFNTHHLHHRQHLRRDVLICRAEFSNEAPFIVAIGSSMLSSLFLATPASEDDDADGTLIGSTDTRFGVMGVISFIPLFNWLSWVFAWLDTGKRRYAVYALVYLLPYLRSNLSLSPEESWLPITSFIFCIVHVQLETSIRNGDIEGFQFFNMAAKHLSSMRKDKASHFKGHQETSKEERKREHMNLPRADEQWRVPPKPSSKQPEGLSEDGEDDKRKKH